MFADAPGTRAYAALRCENDAGGRFTNRPSGVSRRDVRPSACAMVSCGLAARPSGAERAAMAVTGATPRPEGLVRHSGECVFTPSPLPARGRSGPTIPAGRRRARRNRRVPVLVGDAGQPDGQPVGRRLETALDTLPGRIAGTLATPRGRGWGCASTPGPEPVPGPRTGGSLASRPVPPARHGPDRPREHKTWPQQRIRAGPGAHCASAEVRIGPPCRLRAQVRP